MHVTRLAASLDLIHTIESHLRDKVGFVLISFRLDSKKINERRENYGNI